MNYSDQTFPCTCGGDAAYLDVSQVKNVRPEAQRYMAMLSTMNAYLPDEVVTPLRRLVPDWVKVGQAQFIYRQDLNGVFAGSTFEIGITHRHKGGNPVILEFSFEIDFRVRDICSYPGENNSEFHLFFRMLKRKEETLCKEHGYGDPILRADVCGIQNANLETGLAIRELVTNRRNLRYLAGMIHVLLPET